MKYESDYLDIIEGLGSRLCTPMSDSEMNLLRRNALEYTKRRRFELAKIDSVLRNIRMAQKSGDEVEELKLLKQLNELEQNNANT